MRSVSITRGAVACSWLDQQGGATHVVPSVADLRATTCCLPNSSPQPLVSQGSSIFHFWHLGRILLCRRDCPARCRMFSIISGSFTISTLPPLDFSSWFWLPHGHKMAVATPYIMSTFKAESQGNRLYQWSSSYCCSLCIEAKPFPEDPPSILPLMSHWL